MKNSTIMGRVIATRRAHSAVQRSSVNTVHDVTIQTQSGHYMILTTAANASVNFAIEGRDMRERFHYFTIDGRGRIAKAERVLDRDDFMPGE